ncbi:retrovirus-related pol polyprotein from transposon TNT 1-94 [Tanacetum coccineum]
MTPLRLHVLTNSIKITRAHTSEKTSTMLNEIESLGSVEKAKRSCFTSDSVKPKVLAPGMYAIDVNPIPHPLKNNRSAHLNYSAILRESVETDSGFENQKRQLSDTVLNKTSGFGKQRAKLFAGLVIKMDDTGKKFTLGKLNYGYQLRPTGKKFALGEMCPLTKLSVKCIIGIWTKAIQKFDGGIVYLKAQETLWKVHQDSQIREYDHSELSWDWRYVIVAFRKHTCFVRDINGTDILKGSRSTNLYTISIDEMMKSSPICLLSKASKSKSWLWHRRLNHLNFGTINDLARKDLVRGLPRLKFEKDHLCSACQLGKSKKFSHRPKSENTNMEVLHTLHMDLCGPMRVQSIKGKKYILVIVDDYSRFTWVKFLRSKDETPEFVINFLKQMQVGLNKTVRFIRTDNGTEFVNQVMSEYYEGVGIFHQKSVPRTPQQNGVVERRNRTLVEAARTMMIFSKAPMFLWAEAVATALFGALCYPTNDSEDLGKFQAKADFGIFVGTQAFHLDPGQLTSGLAPTDKELEMLFQPMFDEHLEQSRVNEPVPSATEITAHVVPPCTSLTPPNLHRSGTNSLGVKS